MKNRMEKRHFLEVSRLLLFARSSPKHPQEFRYLYNDKHPSLFFKIKDHASYNSLVVAVGSKIPAIRDVGLVWTQRGQVTRVEVPL